MFFLFLIFLSGHLWVLKSLSCNSPNKPCKRSPLGRTHIYLVAVPLLYFRSAESLQGLRRVEHLLNRSCVPFAPTRFGLNAKRIENVGNLPKTEPLIAELSHLLDIFQFSLMCHDRSLLPCFAIPKL